MVLICHEYFGTFHNLAIVSSVMVNKNIQGYLLSPDNYVFIYVVKLYGWDTF